MATQAKQKASGKSGLRILAPSEVLFNDGDPSDSLYIIQKGQLRLYKPKGRGFVEIAVLRTGEVIGEMAFFDDDGGGRRSCSASAMVTTEIIEISFTAFAKTMSGLNPWFKTIINTLAKRLRKTNARVKELETNSVGLNYGGKQAEYEFLKPIEVVKMLGTMFLVFKAHAKTHPMGAILDKKTLSFYANDVYTLLDVKMDTLLLILEELQYIHIEGEEDAIEKNIIVKNLEMMRQIFLQLNAERFLEEDKKVKVSAKCEMFLIKILEHIKKVNPKVEAIEIVINQILTDFKERNIVIGIQDLADAEHHGICGEPLVDDTGTVRLQVDVDKLKKTLPIIRFKTALKRGNTEKN